MKCERIKSLREDHDLSQKQVAEALFISRSVYGNYENGFRKFPIDIVIALAEYYHVSVDYLLGLTNNPKRNI